MSNLKDLQPLSTKTVTQSIAPAIGLWVDATTDVSSPRRRDLIRDKTRIVLDFFAFVDKPPAAVDQIDVKQWQAHLEGEGLKPATVYAMISRLSAFYGWAIDQGRADRNPTEGARPKAPKAYQSGGSQALSDQAAQALLSTIKAEADQGKLSARRDYAMTVWYFLSGMRRREIASLTWGDLEIIGNTVLIKAQVKGGDFVTREIADDSALASLLDYLEASDRLDSIAADSPLWTAHDRSGMHTGKALTSHAFAKNLKRYAKLAGIGDIHLHQTRHTFARWVGEDSGSLTEAQEALGHKNLATTRVYLSRVAVRKDKHSRKIAGRLKGKDL